MLFLDNPKKQYGFTFIEVILYVGIVSITTTALISYALNISGIRAKSGSQEEVSASARYLSERIKFVIRNANDINTAQSNFGVNLAQTPGTKLTLRTNITNPPNDPTVVDVVAGQARIKQGLNPNYFLNSNVTNLTNLTFTNYTSSDNKTKHIGFTLTLQARTTSTRQEFTNSVTLESSAEVRSN